MPRWVVGDTLDMADPRSIPDEVFSNGFCFVKEMRH